MARLLALDVGEKTIGVAVSDETETFAFPGETILRQEGYRRDMNALRRLVEEKEIAEIVVGLPLMMDGSRGIQVEKIEAFVEQLRRYVIVPVVTQDERLSTLEAEKLLLTTDKRRDERKKVVDSMAASVILQSFMDRRRARNTDEKAKGT
jgi:putative Holliday junction resolvase